MEHIERRHILPYAPPGSTTFLSQEVSVVEKLIEETRNYPDVVQAHSGDSKKIVLKKRFPYNIGRHGIYGAYCRVLLVVLRENEKKTGWKLVTAFPVM